MLHDSERPRVTLRILAGEHMLGLALLPSLVEFAYLSKMKTELLRSPDREAVRIEKESVFYS